MKQFTSSEITEGLDLLGDFLDAKGYTEEAGLCTRAMDEINRLRDDRKRLLQLLDEALEGYADCIPYKCEYLVEKHGDKEEWARLKAARAAMGETNEQ